jgi:hypothetical protein
LGRQLLWGNAILEVTVLEEMKNERKVAVHTVEQVKQC